VSEQEVLLDPSNARIQIISYRLDLHAVTDSWILLKIDKHANLIPDLPVSSFPFEKQATGLLKLV